MMIILLGIHILLQIIEVLKIKQKYVIFLPKLEKFALHLNIYADSDQSQYNLLWWRIEGEQQNLYFFCLVYFMFKCI